MVQRLPLVPAEMWDGEDHDSEKLQIFGERRKGTCCQRVSVIFEAVSNSTQEQINDLRPWDGGYFRQRSVPVRSCIIQASRVKKMQQGCGGGSNDNRAD